MTDTYSTFTNHASLDEIDKKTIGIYVNGLKNSTTLPIDLRISKVMNFAQKFAHNVEKASITVSEETGTPITYSRNIHSRIGERAKYLASVAKNVLKEEQVVTNDSINIITRTALGVVAVISTWNYPIDVPLSAILPALLAGNKVIFKPSEYAHRSARVFCKLLEEEFGSDYFIAAYGGKKTAQRIIRNQNIDSISFTGHTNTAKSIVKTMHPFVKTHFNLTGKDSLIILEDADIKNITKDILYGAFRNNGASCSAVQNIYIPNQFLDEFTKCVETHIDYFSVGPATSESTQIGPIYNQYAQDQYMKLVKYAHHKSYRTIEYTKKIPKDPYFLRPLIIISHINDRTIRKIDIFGPAVVVFGYENISTVVDIIKNNNYGLTSSVYGQDKDTIELLDKNLEVGTLSINSLGRSNIDVPWSGRRKSGYGVIRSKYSILEFTSFKVKRFPKSMNITRLSI